MLTPLGEFTTAALLVLLTGLVTAVLAPCPL